jgi:hypothetical protein
MPNGTLKLYNKLNNSLLVSLDILGTFNIEDNLNETPSNMKVKVITSNTYREEFQVNTVAYHEDTNSWWVIKSDESTYLMTGEYEHEIQLVEYLEFYAYRHLPNCAFAPNTYTLEQMLLRLFDIAKLSISVNYPNFLDKDKIMPFFSFENFTVANAVKNISRSINAIPKFSVGSIFNELPIIIVFTLSPPSSPIEGSFWFRIDTNQLYIRQDFAWVLIPDVLYGTTLPTNSPGGTLFVNTATQKLLSSTFRPTLTFINRNGLDNAIVETLNTQFPIAYEKNMNSNDQFTTRSVSNITNAKSSVLVITPKNGGLKNTIQNNIVFDSTTRLGARVLLPSKIDKIEWLNVLVPVSIMYEDEFSPPGRQVIFTGYFTNKADFENALTNSNLFGSSRPFTNADLTTAISRLPDPETFYRVNYGDVIDKNFLTNTVANKSPVFFKKMSLRSKFEFDTVSKLVNGVLEPDNDTKERTAHWLPNTNELVMPLSFRNSLTANSDHNVRYMLLGENTNGQKRLSLTTETLDGALLRTVIKNETILIQIAYYPIADIKVSVDNDNDAQDEKFFNQSGKVIDAVSVSKLITSHTNDSVEGTKIRNAKYAGFSYQLFTGTFSFGGLTPPTGATDGTYWFSSLNILRQRIDGSFVVVESDIGTNTPFNVGSSGLRFVNTATQQLFISQEISFNSTLPLGQLVRDNNQIYIVTQRSIDGHIKNGNEYYNVIYTLSRNRVARSENIVADSAVISYKTPDDNLVFRSQLYKDYIELSLANITPKDTPYLSMSKALVLSDTLAGTNFDYTVLARNQFSSSTVRYVKNPTTFDLHKSKLVNVNWQDNNVLGFRFDRAVGVFTNTLVQTPILYTDEVGKATNFELLFLDTNNLETAKNSFNTSFSGKADDLIPFRDLTQVDVDYYNTSVLANGRFSIRIQEDTSSGKPYQKDPFEIPVFEYMIQGNDDYTSIGNIVIGSDLFTTFTGNIRYHYIINNTTRFSAENANRLYNANAPTGLTNRRVDFSRPSGVDGTQIQMILYNAFDPNASPFPILTQNTSDISNVGVYAVQGGTGVVKFLFAINDYNMTSKSIFNIYINNWKI